MKALLAGTVMLVFACMASPSRANLGDTLAKCEARYGPALPGKDTPDPSGVGDVILCFQSRGYNVRMILVHGYVGGEAFAKTDGSPLADAEIKMLLNNEANGWAWARSTGTVGDNWLRTDGAVATYAPQFRSLVIETGPYVNAVNASQARHSQGK
jgi:hypothetical protein